jgi:hypothetical protein
MPAEEISKNINPLSHVENKFGVWTTWLHNSYAYLPVKQDLNLCLDGKICISQYEILSLCFYWDYLETSVSGETVDSLFFIGDVKEEDRSVVTPQHSRWFSANNSTLSSIITLNLHHNYNAKYL